jgi:miniconductance mechanosensitive channel
MNEQLIQWFQDRGLPSTGAETASWLSLALAVLLGAWLAYLIIHRVLLVVIHRIVERTKSTWDDALLHRKVFSRAAHLAPAIVISNTAGLFPPIQSEIERFASIYMIVIGIGVINGLLRAVVDIYQTFESARNRPIKGYIQVVQIIVWIIGAIIIISMLINKSPLYLLGGLGAMTAVIILVFKDSILGLVASVQLSNNDMVRIGDWIEMPQYGADGTVIDVTLHTVKVQNWDKTITTIPSYALISNSFKNWRGMEESGGRRIKRSIYIDMQSIKFCTEDMLKRFRRFQRIRDYIEIKLQELRDFNERHQVDTKELINGRRLTNIGTFRAYVAAYLRNHPMVHTDMTFLVRHLQPTEHGLPIEVYVFCKDQRWAFYEAIQADIFDHLLAVVPLFELRVFQRPSGADLRSLASDMAVPRLDSSPPSGSPPQSA